MLLSSSPSEYILTRRPKSLWNVENRDFLRHMRLVKANGTFVNLTWTHVLRSSSQRKVEPEWNTRVPWRSVSYLQSSDCAFRPHDLLTPPLLFLGSFSTEADDSESELAVIPESPNSDSSTHGAPQVKRRAHVNISAVRSSLRVHFVPKEPPSFWVFTDLNIWLFALARKAWNDALFEWSFRQYDCHWIRKVQVLNPIESGKSGKSGRFPEQSGKFRVMRFVLVNVNQHRFFNTRF